MTEKRFEKIPKIVINDEESCNNGKCVAQIKEIIRLVKKVDGTDKRNLLIAKNYDNDLQKLSNGRIGLRIWIDWDNSLRCVVVYPNSAIKELMEF